MLVRMIDENSLRREVWFALNKKTDSRIIEQRWYVFIPSGHQLQLMLKHISPLFDFPHVAVSWSALICWHPDKPTLKSHNKRNINYTLPQSFLSFDNQ